MKNPIDKEQKSRLNGAKRKLVSAVELLQRAKACGIDCDEREQALFTLSQALDAIQANFVGEQAMSGIEANMGKPTGG